MEIGTRVELTFRRLYTAGGVHNYFWKARPVELMASNGIRDQVAIVGMGCTPFGEHWDRSADDLLVDAVERVLQLDQGHRRAPTSTPTGSAP